ncbi:WG repeat-containing protein [Flammeovirga pacifica]|uniref:WG repeat-containing protein n=1 Tax=Flammeovirga pacifica TaxID=915059 RepID=A0A1S1YWY9_FLAPC|nr:WG repeat-containing protein [Flammeovirga pacifica]OHX65413.1 hypothetical protein NH26_03140 [Flammeovirga pacifica]
MLLLKNKSLLIIIIIIVIIGCTYSLLKTNKVPHSDEDIIVYTDLTIDAPDNYLIAFSSDSLIELGSPIGYVDAQGDTIIPIGKYSHCWVDTLKHFAIVFDSIKTNNEVFAIDRNENRLFDIYFFDNWIDEPQEGLFRVKRNGKVGFANENGEIVIPCIYSCAYRFYDGIAQVAFNCETTKDWDEHTTLKSDEWFFIDKKGNRITEAQ